MNIVVSVVSIPQYVGSSCPNRAVAGVVVVAAGRIGWDFLDIVRFKSEIGCGRQISSPAVGIAIVVCLVGFDGSGDVFDVGLGRGQSSPLPSVQEVGDGDNNQDSDNGHYDEQFDQGETPVIPSP